MGMSIKIFGKDFFENGKDFSYFGKYYKGESTVKMGQGEFH